jgi:hypothetical protein
MARSLFGALSLITEFDTYGFIPRALRARFAKVVGDALRRVNQSQGAARDQALRWVLAIPQLFLRRTCCGAGRRVKRQIEGRLDQWERRDFYKLVGDWKHDISVHQPHHCGRRGLTARLLSCEP